MPLLLNNHIKICKIKEGIALFDNFTGNTYFLPSSFNKLLSNLTDKYCSEDELLNSYLADYQINSSGIDEASKQFQQFITEALKSGIIIETS